MYIRIYIAKILENCTILISIAFKSMSEYNRSSYSNTPATLPGWDTALYSCQALGIP